MNSLELTIAAGKAVEDFTKHNDTACVVYFRNGLVCCCPTREAIGNSPTCLIFSRLQQHHGLSAAAWETVGTELFNQQNKEKTASIKSES